MPSVIVRRRLLRTRRVALVGFCLVAAALSAIAADQPKPYVAPTKMGINKDAMTMQECRDRLAAPKRERPPSDDPSIDKDAVCANMLGSDKTTHKPRATGAARAKAASAP